MTEPQTSIRRGPRREYFYATAMDDVIRAYKPEEWGLGGNLPSGNYTTRSPIGLVVVMVLLTVPAILAPVMMVLGAVSLNLGIFLLFLVCTVLFTGGWFVGLGSLRSESKARKLRRAKGLPKPRYGVTDDQARRWFEAHPGTVDITRENFPASTYAFPVERPKGSGDGIGF
ncbi:hypothetical protein [Arthrobacter sp. CJ23]|uniref:hypothetical protein n=1 Tax=Arthrobacter sp. CJ23 TaxID=2972479 RepID=UPI00215C6BDA|nr:hypothetical protein [Arthrobacter sp. CJ23]UVJ38606.1 hypothetical protein NVV90_15450 [Arthrobacter sp. CJ23]